MNLKNNDLNNSSQGNKNKYIQHYVHDRHELPQLFVERISQLYLHSVFVLFEDNQQDLRHYNTEMKTNGMNH